MNARGVALRLLQRLRPERGVLLLALGCMALSAVTTAAYGWLAGPLLGWLLRGGGESSPLLRAVPGLAERLGPELLPWLLPLALLLVATVKSAAYLGQFFWMGMVGQRVVKRLREELHASLLARSPVALAAFGRGDVLTRFTTDLDALERFTTYGIAALARDGLQLAVLVLLVFALDPLRAAVVFGLVPLLALPVSRLARTLKRRLTTGQEALGQLGDRLGETLEGHRVLRIHGAEGWQAARFEASLAAQQQALTQAARAKTLSPALMELALVTALAAVLAWAGRAVASGSTQGEQLISFAVALGLLYQPAKELGRVSPWWIAAVAAGERLFGLLEAVDPLPADPQQPLALPPLSGALRFEEVSLALGGRPVLTGLTFEVRAGEVVALVGESGSGKSTALSLLFRFLEPDSGRITWDGLEVRQATRAALRAQLALVTQEALLLAGSVEENLRLARPGATEAELREALEQASAWEFVQRLPQGLATPLGERGVTLSGGQRQRIALARALLARAPLLVLDEATSALDPESEREVQAALDRLLGRTGGGPRRTALVVAHRLSTVRDADRICVLEQGRVVEQGDHAALLALGGRYARWHALQGGAAANAGG